MFRRFSKNAGTNQPTGEKQGQTQVSRELSKNEPRLRQLFADCHDVRIEKLEINRTLVLLVYCPGLCDTKKINETVIPSLQTLHPTEADFNAEILRIHLPLSAIDTGKTMDSVGEKVFNGELILFFDGIPAFYALDIANPPHRNPEESNTEVSIRGPRDGFVEEIGTNVALVRKRLHTPSLCYEQFIVGKRSLTKVGLLYIKDIIRPEIIREVRRRLSAIDVDTINSTAGLMQLISDSPVSLFPLMDHVGRPDYVLDGLVRGRFAVIVDGNPTVIIGPANFPLLLKSPEDTHTESYLYVAMERILRMFGLVIALFLPGFWVAITTYHQDQIPLTLLGTLVMARKGVPIPTPVEAIIMLLLFELFREAGARLPAGIGQTIAVVGGLIIGDAAIRAGLTSPSLLVIVGTTAVATFTLINVSLSGTVGALRLGVLIVSSFLGIYGFLISVFAVVVYLANLRSFGMPYLAPVSPFGFRDFINAVILLPKNLLNRRPDMTDPVDPTRQGKRR
jgi:hypothetical protein